MYGTDIHDFERLTGLHEGSKVVYQLAGVDECRVGILVYHKVGAGFDLISLIGVIDRDNFIMYDGKNIKITYSVKYNEQRL